jgi:hypothetical protein
MTGLPEHEVHGEGHAKGFVIEAKILKKGHNSAVDRKNIHRFPCLPDVLFLILHDHNLLSEAFSKVPFPVCTLGASPGRSISGHVEGHGHLLL